MAASPIEIVIQILQSVWSVYVAGTLRAFPKMAHWIVDGTWFTISMKFGMVFLAVIIAKSMWQRIADVGDGNPMVPVVAVALILGAAIAGLVAHATGLWTGFALHW